jgi:hypothetical protein
MPSTKNANHQIGNPFNLPMPLPGTYRLEIDGPEYEIMSSWTEENLIEAFKNWIVAVRPKNYKFIVLVLETSHTSLEIKLNHHIAENREFYDLDSGSELLIVHNCSRHGPNETLAELIRRTGLWLDSLEISRVSLPALVVIPHTRYRAIRESQKKMMTYTFGEDWRNWNGSDDDFFITIFRALFDATDQVLENDSDPIRTLNKKFRKSLKKILGTTMADRASTIVNLPVVGHIVKIIAML